MDIASSCLWKTSLLILQHITESERLPQMCAKQVCCICGFYNGHKHGCNIECQASARKDGKDVYEKSLYV